MLVVLLFLAATRTRRRSDHVRMMIYGLVGLVTFVLTLSAVLAVLTFLGLMSPWLLLAFTFSIACGQALHIPSWQASVGDLVPKAHIPQAVALNGMGFNLMRSTGRGTETRSGGQTGCLRRRQTGYTARTFYRAPDMAVN